MKQTKYPQKNIDDLRSILSEEIDNLKAGKTVPARTNAISNSVGKVLTTVKLQLEFMKLTGKKTGSAQIQKMLMLKN